MWQLTKNPGWWKTGQTGCSVHRYSGTSTDTANHLFASRLNMELYASADFHCHEAKRSSGAPSEFILFIFFFFRNLSLRKPTQLVEGLCLVGWLCGLVGSGLGWLAEGGVSGLTSLVVQGTMFGFSKWVAQVLVLSSDVWLVSVLCPPYSMVGLHTPRTLPSPKWRHQLPLQCLQLT